jgi:hypothetical protein
MTLYHCIIDLHDYNDETLAALMSDCNSIDEQAIAEYLSQWDYGEYHDQPREICKDFNSRLYNCTVEYSGEYVLKVDTSMGTASLYIEANEND